MLASSRVRVPTPVHHGIYLIEIGGRPIRFVTLGFGAGAILGAIICLGFLTTNSPRTPDMRPPWLAALGTLIFDLGFLWRFYAGPTIQWNGPFDAARVVAVVVLLNYAIAARVAYLGRRSTGRHG